MMSSKSKKTPSKLKDLATNRSLPNPLYLEFLNREVKIKLYSKNPRRISRKNLLISKLKTWNTAGRRLKLMTRREKVLNLANSKIFFSPLCGSKFSLFRSFKPSITGWSIPARPTLFGLNRFWVSPRNSRSNRVKKAIESKSAKILKRPARVFKKKNDITLCFADTYTGNPSN